MQHHDEDAPTITIRKSVEAPARNPHGQAALLLAESILHALIETKVLTPAQAVAVVQIAADVHVETATLAEQAEGRMKESIDLLYRLETSLAADAPLP